MADNKKVKTLRVPEDLDAFIQEEADRNYEGNYSMAAIRMLRMMQRRERTSRHESAAVADGARS